MILERILIFKIIFQSYFKIAPPEMIARDLDSKYVCSTVNSEFTEEMEKVFPENSRRKMQGEVTGLMLAG